MYQVFYTDPHGVQWDLKPPKGTGRVRLADDGIQDIVGKPEPTAYPRLNRPGQVVTAFHAKEMGGTLKVLFVDHEHEGLEQLGRAWRAAWSAHTPGILTVAGATYGRVETKVRLAEVPDAYSRAPGNRANVVAEHNVVADSGMWWTQQIRASGTVEVTNPGDVMVWPRISWQGAGGVVVLPSGYRFTLPRVSAPREVFLDDDVSCAVYDEQGRIDWDLFTELSGRVLAEGIPPGQRRTYRLPAGAHLIWQIGVFDPWA